MSERRIIRPVRRPEPPSRVATVAFFLALLVVGSAITSALFLPTSLEDFVWGAVIIGVLETIGWAFHAIWARIRRKRRREQLMG